MLNRIFFIFDEGPALNETYALETYLNFVAYFEPLVFAHESFESLCQSYVVPDVLLQTGNAIVAYHEPEFKRAESSAEWNSPVAVVYCRVRVAMLHNERQHFIITLCITQRGSCVIDGLLTVFLCVKNNVVPVSN
jgi:hypothetical protein